VAFTKINQAIRCFENEIGARLKPSKSKAVAVGAFSEPVTVLGIGSHDQVDIIDLFFGSTLALSMKYSWTGVVGTVRAQELEAYARNLCLAHRLLYVQLWLLAKIWYVTQVFPPIHVHAQQLTPIC